MLNELVRRFTRRGVERRAAHRIRRRYPIAWLREGAPVPAVGLEISEKGVLFATKDVPAGSRIDVALDLGRRRIRARLNVTRTGPVMRDGVEWTLVAAVYEGIAVEDWDAIVRFCQDVPEPENRAAGGLAALAGTDDDAYRLLPPNVQQRVVSTLAAAGRLASRGDTKSPLLRMRYLGVTRRGVHRLSVHSRRAENAEVRHFNSVVLIDDRGNVTLES